MLLLYLHYQNLARDKCNKFGFFDWESAMEMSSRSIPRFDLSVCRDRAERPVGPGVTGKSRTAAIAHDELFVAAIGNQFEGGRVAADQHCRPGVFEADECNGDLPIGIDLVSPFVRGDLLAVFVHFRMKVGHEPQIGVTIGADEVAVPGTEEDHSVPVNNVIKFGDWCDATGVGRWSIAGGSIASGFMAACGRKKDEEQ